MPHPAPAPLRLVDPDRDAVLVELRAIRRLLRVLVARTPKLPLQVCGRAATPMEQDLLRVATVKSQSPKTLARLAGKTMGSHVSTALTALCRANKLVRDADGYRLPPAKK